MCPISDAVDMNSYVSWQWNLITVAVGSRRAERTTSGVGLPLGRIKPSPRYREADHGRLLEHGPWPNKSTRASDSQIYTLPVYV